MRKHWKRVGLGVRVAPPVWSRRWYRTGAAFAVVLVAVLMLASDAAGQHPPWILGAGAHIVGDWIYDPVRVSIPDAAWADVTIPAAGAMGDYMGADWTGGMWWNTYIIRGPEPYVDLGLVCTLGGKMSAQVELALPGEEALATVRVAAAAGEPGDWGEAILHGYVTETGPVYEYREDGALEGAGQWDGAFNVVFDQASVLLMLHGMPVGVPFELDQELGTTASGWENGGAYTNFFDTFSLEQFVLPPGHSIEPIPEPATLGLLLVGGLILFKRTR